MRLFQHIKVNFNEVTSGLILTPTPTLFYEVVVRLTMLTQPKGGHCFISSIQPSD